jgi:hypothetical protein
VREVFIRILAKFEGSGLKDAAAQQREVAQATRDATKAAEQQARTTTTQATPADRTAAVAKDAVATATKKSAGTLEELRRAGGPATAIMQGFSQAAAGGVQSVNGLANAGKGVVAAMLGGFGPAGIIATAAGVVGGLVGALIRVKQPAEDAAEGIRAVVDSTKQIQEANLDNLRAQFAEINAQANAAIAQLDAALERKKRIADADTEAEIATIRARQRGGAISPTPADEQVDALELERRVRGIQDPAERARIRADAAAADAARAGRAEQGIEGRAVAARDRATLFGRDRRTQEGELDAARGELNELLTRGQFRGNVEQRERSQQRIRELETLIPQLESDIVISQEREAAAAAEFETLNAELIAARKRRIAAEETAAVAAERAAGETATAEQLTDAARRTAAANALGDSKEQGRGSVGRPKTRNTFDPSAIPGLPPLAGTIEVLDEFGFDRTPKERPQGSIDVRGSDRRDLADVLKQAAKEGVAEGLSDIPRRASGAPSVKKGEPQVVGDGGRPELFVPQENGAILPSVDDGIIRDNKEATSGQYAPTAPSRPRVISSNAEAMAESALESAAFAARNGGKGFDASDQANAGKVRDFAQREPERWAQMQRDALDRLAGSIASNNAAVLQSQQQMLHYLREIYLQNKKVGVA